MLIYITDFSNSLNKPVYAFDYFKFIRTKKNCFLYSQMLTDVVYVFKIYKKCLIFTIESIVNVRIQFNVNLFP